MSDHLGEERLAIHVHNRHVEPTNVQDGWSQINVQYRSLEESGDKMQSNKNLAAAKVSARCARLPPPSDWALSRVHGP